MPAAVSLVALTARLAALRPRLGTLDARGKGVHGADPEAVVEAAHLNAQIARLRRAGADGGPSMEDCRRRIGKVSRAHASGPE